MVEEHGIGTALVDLAAGRPVVLVDDRGEGTLVFAAAAATPALLAFTVRHTSGCVCVALQGGACERLGLPPMHGADRQERGRTHTVTVDARTGITTGISARDRARTLQLLADPAAVAGDLVRPGHVLPLRAAEGGVLGRAEPAEAAVDLVRLAGQQPAAALCEIVSVRRPGAMARARELAAFALVHGLALVTVGDVVAHRRWGERHVVRATESLLPTLHGTFRAIGYSCTLDGSEHIALVLGEVGAGRAVRVELHAECRLGDVFGSRLCGCRDRLEAALAAVAADGSGVVVYVGGASGREIRCGAVPDGTAELVTAQILGDLGVPAAPVDDRHAAVSG